MKVVVANYNPKASFLIEGLSDWLTEQHIEFEHKVIVDKDELIELCQNAEVFIATTATYIDKTLMQALPGLRLVIAWGSGYEQIDIAEATRQGIIVSNAGPYSNPDVAEMALTLIFACGRKLSQHLNLVTENRWSGRTDLHPIYRFKGRTVGLLGFGKIARDLCWRLKGVGFTVQAADPYVEAETLAEYGVKKVDMESLFRTSDFVSLHLRVNQETRHIINEKTLSWMKPEAYLINVSRGALVDESALIHALEQRKISGAGLDVLEREPPSEDHPLLHFPNVTITPHCGAGTVETRSQHVSEWAATIENLLKGHYPFRNQINPEVIPKPVNGIFEY